MKNILLVIIFVMGSLVSFSQVDRSKAPEAGEPKPLELGKLQAFQLKNGLKVFLSQTKDYPKFTMSINIQQPSIDDEDKMEAKTILGKAYTEKLSQKYQNGEIDSISNYLGAMLTASPFNGNLKGMKRDADQLLSMYSDLLLNPLIKEEYISEKAEYYKTKQLKKALQKPNEKEKKSDNIAGYLIDSLINGKAKKEIKEEKILNYDLLKIKDVEKYRRERVVANNSLVVVMGDFTVSECKKLLEKYLGHWNNGEAFATENEQIGGKPTIKNRTIVVIDNPNAVQSNISFHWPIQDAFMFFDKENELNVLNEIFGSSQLSYLYKNLREDKGLCYYIHSNIATTAAGGSAFISTQVRNEKTDLAIENIILEMLRIRNEEINDHDLLVAKNSLIGDFNRSLSVISPIPYISLAMSKETYNLPDDYLQTKVTKIFKVTQKDVQEMAKKYINPFECLIIVKGKASEIKGKLEKFGTVSYFDEDGKEISK